MNELHGMVLLLLLVSGFGIGVLGSVLGIGGGVFIVPLLVLVLKLPIQQAIAVSLVSIVATSSAVAAVNVERGLTNMRLGIVLEVTTAIGAIGGALLLKALPAELLQTLFALMLGPVAATMFWKGWRAWRRRGLSAAAADVTAVGAVVPGKFDAAFYDPAVGAAIPYTVRHLGPAAGASLAAGSLSGLLGLGGGIIQVPVMNLLCGVPIKAAAATSNFLMGVSAAASALIFLRQGLVLPEVAATMVVGVLVGSFVGVRVLYRIRAEKLQVLFAVLMLVVAAKMLLKVFA
ncbi:MAG: sulfite exporter TauE/SafE family protein [Lentisphaeria bacterium]